MLKDIKLKFGRAEGLDNQTLKAMPITVFVGPNNSGKSKILSEIQQFCTSGNQNTNNVIIENIDLEGIEESVLDAKIKSLTLKANPGEAIHPDYILVGKGQTRHQVQETLFRQALLTPNVHPSHTCSWFLSYNTLILNGSNRINLVNQQGAGDLQQPPHSSFQVLFRDDDKRQEVSRIIHEAFGQYLVIDPTNLGQLNLRLSKVPPKDTMEERGIHQEAVDFHAKALPISLASDGVKAFTGMVTEMIAGDPSVLLMDEPEAFLHPSLSFKLGKEVSQIMSGTDKRLFVATHSPNFVMGCIQSGAPVNIVRLTYRNDVATARILPNEDILKLMRNPLLRSTGVLSGLFYEFVIVTESDADRAFYQEINDRLLKSSDQRGIPNCLFLHAQNKQTVKTIIKPLRELGIPVAGIVDIDVLKDGGTVWTGFLDSGSIPELERAPLASLRQALKQKFEESGKNMKRDGGIKILSEDDQEALQNFFDKLADYGLFVVPNGELESWLMGLSASGHGPSWLVEIFEKMGEDPLSENYLKPEYNDVWRFIDSIAAWFLNPRRKGIPK
ncbi:MULTISPECIES: ATP-dependent endonuclease [Shewanella]|uniref:ATP-dependent nuclease n=1 Tax=Shewanella TaxID=22 RepID=UPI000F4EEDEB|nr:MULTISPECIES: AAA family ATPase [Shewanella]MBB1321888.1 AAA family ATPase [Shewanella sp. SR43-8]MBB1391895.1 AAA family ATPase [Shewanella sp. SG44-6]RPA56757.1 ATP-binding protein [Shewanella vesiculosa]UJL43508.1 AAA family ATPase [Shewanella vesiculosa]